MAAALHMTDLPEDLELFFRRVTCTKREQRCLIAVRTAHGRPLQLASYDLIRAALSAHAPVLAWALPHALLEPIGRVARALGRNPGAVLAMVIEDGLHPPRDGRGWVARLLGKSPPVRRKPRAERRLEAS